MTYTIQRGDTLSALARRFNTTVSELARLNNIADPNRIYAGRSLQLPDSPGAGAGTQNPYGGQTPQWCAPTGTPASGSLQALAARLSALEAQEVGEYGSAYAARIEALLKKIEERKAFSYDHTEDPLYAQYEQSYTQNGKLAMLDSMGSATGLTGGYGSSYGEQVGQQSYQAYMQALGDKIPELAEDAYTRYVGEGDALYEQLAAYGELDAADYARYRDDVADHYKELAYLYQKYTDASDDEYRRYQDALNMWLAQQKLGYEQQQDALAQSNWEREFARKSAAARKSSGGSGSGSGSGDNEAATERLYELFEGLTPDIRKGVLADRESIEYIQNLLGMAGYRAFVAKYGA